MDMARLALTINFPALSLHRSNQNAHPSQQSLQGQTAAPFQKPTTLSHHGKQLLMAKFNSLVCPGSRFNIGDGQDKTETDKIMIICRVLYLLDSPVWVP